MAFLSSTTNLGSLTFVQHLLISNITFSWQQILVHHALTTFQVSACFINNTVITLYFNIKLGAARSWFITFASSFYEQWVQLSITQFMVHLWLTLIKHLFHHLDELQFFSWQPFLIHRFLFHELKFVPFKKTVDPWW